MAEVFDTALVTAPVDTDTVGRGGSPGRRMFGLGRARPRSGRRGSLLDLGSVGLVVLVTIVAILAPWLAPHSATVPAGTAFTPPLEDGFLFGTDQVGRDILSRCLVGLRASWFATLGIVGSIAVIGIVVGTIAGLLGGWVDSILMRITDFFLALPIFLVAIVFVASMGPSLFHASLALTLVAWPYYARMVRGEVRSIAARPFVEAARLSGISRGRLALRHILPGVFPVVVVAMSMDLGAMTIGLALLSFLGLGVPAPAPELGSMVSTTTSYVLSYWWVPLMPAAVVFVVALVGNLAGDGVRDWLGDR